MQRTVVRTELIVRGSGEIAAPLGAGEHARVGRQRPAAQGAGAGLQYELAVAGRRTGLRRRVEGHRVPAAGEGDHTGRAVEQDNPGSSSRRTPISRRTSVSIESGSSRSASTL